MTPINGNGAVSKGWLLGIVAAALFGLLGFLGSAMADRQTDAERRLNVVERDMAAIRSDVSFIREAVSELRRRP